MKYIRTKDGKLKIEYRRFTTHNGKVLIDTADEDFFYEENQILKEADTIEELCDEFVAVWKRKEDDTPYLCHCWFYEVDNELCIDIDNVDAMQVSGLFKIDCGSFPQPLKQFIKKDVAEIKGGIWTDKGFIYVTKPMTKEGKFELL